MNEAIQIFVIWLSLKTTLITVLAPFILLLAHLVFSCKRKQVMTLKLCGVGILCAPFTILTSFWSAQGLHILPVILIPLLYLELTAKIDARKQWMSVAAATWIATIVPDIIGAWSMAYKPDFKTWYYGVGNLGFDDSLFVGPIVITVALCAISYIRFRSQKNIVKSKEVLET